MILSRSSDTFGGLKRGRNLNKKGENTGVGSPNPESCLTIKNDNTRGWGGEI